MSLIDSEDFGTSAQVLQEFFVTVVKKAAEPLAPERALEWIEEFSRFPCRAIDPGLVRIAAEYSSRYRITYWDAAIVAAAEALGCSKLYSEDLNAGQVYAGVRAVNPFMARG